MGVVKGKSEGWGLGSLPSAQVAERPPRAWRLLALLARRRGTAAAKPLDCPLHSAPVQTQRHRFLSAVAGPRMMLDSAFGF